MRSIYEFDVHITLFYIQWPDAKLYVPVYYYIATSEHDVYPFVLTIDVCANWISI